VSAPPYMKLYIADYLADTTHLSRDEHGAYLLLLMALWRAGGKLPRDPGKLAKIARCSPREWEKIGPTIMEFFRVTGGAITQKRASEEIAKYERVVKGSEKAGKASAEKRANKNNKKAATNVDETSGEISTNQNHNQIEDANASITPVPLADVVEAIFYLQPEGFRRSTRPDIRDALQVQLKTGASPAAIFVAVKAYYATPDAKRDGGQYAKAAHRIIQRGRWKDYAPAPKVLTPATPEERARRLRHHRDTGEWRDAWGPRPEPERKSA